MGVVKPGEACYFSLPCVWSMKPALHGHSGPRSRGSTAILSIFGLAQGSQAISNVMAGDAPMHAKKSVRLLHLRLKPKENNMLLMTDDPSTDGKTLQTRQFHEGSGSVPSGSRLNTGNPIGEQDSPSAVLMDHALVIG